MTLARLVASGGGSGFLPRAPGTWGSAVAALTGAGLLAASPWALGLGVLAATLAGFWAIPRSGGDADPGWVVIDEVAGMWLTMLPLGHPSLPGVLAAFALFRLLDITKPGPVGMLDRIHGRFGVMADDLAAGLCGAILVWLVRMFVA